MQNYIEFPKLGWKFFIEPGIQITENFSIKWYGILICIGFILCIFLGHRACEKYGVKKNDLLDYVLISIPTAIIGARLYYVAFTWDYYSQHPEEIVMVWNGGLAIYGGIIGAAIGLIVMSLIKKKNPLLIVDFMLPYVALGQAIGRWGNFVNQEAYGGSTDLPWGMTGNKIAEEFGSALVHPTFLYESLWCFLAFAIMMILRKKLRSPGQMTAVYFILYGIERAFVEGLRTDSLYIGDTGIRVSQVLSGVLVVAGIIILIVTSIRKKKTDEAAEPADDDKISALAKELESGADEAEEAAEAAETAEAAEDAATEGPSEAAETAETVEEKETTAE